MLIPKLKSQAAAKREIMLNVSRRPSYDNITKFQSARDQAFTTWAEITGVAMAA